MCSACAKREGGYRDRDQTRSTNSGSNFRIYPQQQGGSCVGAPAATRFSSLFILSGIFPTKRQKKKKWQERLCFEVVSPGEKLYCFDTGIQSEMMMTTRTTYIRGWYNSDEKRAAFVCLRSPSPGSPRERGSGYKLWLSYYLRYGVFGIIH